MVIAGSVNNDSEPWKINRPTVRRDGVTGRKSGRGWSIRHYVLGLEMAPSYKIQLDFDSHVSTDKFLFYKYIILILPQTLNI